MFDSLAVSIILFTVSAAVIWKAGSSMSFTIDEISDKTGMGKAFAGIFFLGAATSLPEAAAAMSAANMGMPSLAGSNLLGGIAMQMALLALIDAIAVRKMALTSIAPDSAMLMQVGTLCAMNATAIIAILATGEPFWGVGITSFLLFALYLLSLKLVYSYENRPQWQAIHDQNKQESGSHSATDKEKRLKGLGVKQLWARFLGAAVLVLGAAFMATVSARSIIEQAGIEAGVFGAIFMAIATSLPEATTTLAAVKKKSYSLAIGTIFGTNALGVALLFPADIAFREGPILAQFDEKLIFLCALNVLLGAVFLWGILERKDKTIMNMGVDSFAALVVYLAGMGVYATL